MLSDHRQPFMSIVHSDGLVGKFSRTMRNSIRPELLLSGSRSTLLNLDTSASHQNCQTGTLLNISKNMYQKRSPPPLTLTDLWTTRPDLWCQLSLVLLQTLIESMRRRSGALVCACGDPTQY
ncbi:hypothetical protein TNCV_231851 [Trichonephila clavipes]|nr:hypothetical protein TNCV_231851 [Trichonephila clavipes]